MANKMLIDATHPEETRVVVVRGNRVEEFDFETAQRKQLRGNIYLAKVTRVEPSLQAAFIEYGGNRHGFLAFSEIHPDYYQIPMADRQALIEADERAHREEEEESESRSNRRRSRHRNSRRRGNGERVQSEIIEGAPLDAETLEPVFVEGGEHGEASEPSADDAHELAAVADQHDADHHEDAHHDQDGGQHDEPQPHAVASTELLPAVDYAPHHQPFAHDEPAAPQGSAEAAPIAPEQPAAVASDALAPVLPETEAEQTGYAEDAPFPIDQTAVASEAGADESHADHDDHGDDDDDDEDGDDDAEDSEEDVVESVGGDDVLEEVPERAFRPRRQYKIQEVIKRRQVMLVQVVKEERGNKGAALTTYLSLAGRYAVLMPNTARGGGISRKITSAQDRSRLKEVVQDLDVPEGMGIILRTAGASRTKQEIKRDFEYLIRMWETVRDMTLRSQAPTLVYEEGSLIKRSLRDLYNKEIDEIQVAGEAGYREARDFMHMLMPSNVRAVKLYRDAQPLFSRMGVESQLDAMFSPTVQLRSGGYIVINQTEALVAIDVNSGRSTREHHIEDTALKTNLEAAEEVARQLRLRDLAGLIVIDFIDMEEKRNNRAVERKLSECLRQDRARIQIGRISHFGLLEMSRQRIRASVLESSTEPCPHCGGSGHLRSVSSVALQLLRGLEEILMKGATHNLVVRTRTDVALYVLNHKRGHLRDLESSFKVSLFVNADPTVTGQQSYVIDRGDQVHTLEAAKATLAAQLAAVPADDGFEDDDYEFEAEIETDETIGLADEAGATDADGDGEGRSKRKRRRRRRPRSAEAREGAQPQDDDFPIAPLNTVEVVESDESGDEAAEESEGESEGDTRADQNGEGERRPRRRGRRGGRRRRGTGSGNGEDALALGGDDEAAGDDQDLNGDTPQADDTDSDQDDVTEAPSVAAQQPDDQPKLNGAAPQEPQPVEARVVEAPSAEAQPEAAQADEGSEANGHDSKPARRRSTVREKVSFASAPAVAEPQLAIDAPTAPAEPSVEAAVAQAPEVTAEPVAPSADTTEQPPAPQPVQPRRIGWWSRRFGGGQ
ncbi:RNAse E [Rhodopseudomonas faecalis]|uniref:Ribonuclease E n=1 Tax=Rhodopseudomonas faecalis TaxID=99655 RepID=A0A318TF30_9BRAD|nr:ribonuclease E/G [Rhodopseudomonas faecalis]PYF03572.1 RNAse E [Rhodopseudomonas faecalis]